MCTFGNSALINSSIPFRSCIVSLHDFLVASALLNNLTIANETGAMIRELQMLMNIWEYVIFSGPT